MTRNSLRWWPAAALILFMGCGANGKTNSNGSDSSQTSLPMESQPITTSGVAGQWISEVAPDAIMHVRQSGQQIHILWTGSMDADFFFEGDLTSTGPGTYSGKVKFSSGDERQRLEQLTIKLTDDGNALSFDFPPMWEEPITFVRSAGDLNCADAGQMVVERTPVFADLSAKMDGLGVMQETENADARQQDFKIYVDADGEEQTQARLRVDFDRRVVLEYNPAEDSYTAIEGSDAYFEGITCK